MERRGTVVSFDPSTGAGTIEVDGVHFSFQGDDLANGRAPEIGTVVLFEGANGRATAIRSAVPVRRPLSWGWFLFSLRGRVSVSQFWLRYWLPTRLAAVAYFAIVGSLGLSVAAGSVRTVGFLAVLGIFLWICVAVEVKRWHDRGKSGLWMLIALVPLVGPFWALIETGFLGGTRGANAYGADPKEA